MKKNAESTLGPINMQNKKVLGIIAVAIIVVLAGGALLIPSLTSSDIPSAPSGAKMGGTLTMAMASEPNYLDPADWWGSSDIQMIDQIFDSLVQFGFDFKPYPRLAESWTVSDDGKAQASSRALVCKDWHPPRTAANACKETLITLLSGCWAVKAAPDVWAWNLSQ